MTTRVALAKPIMKWTDNMIVTEVFHILKRGVRCFNCAHKNSLNSVEPIKKLDRKTFTGSKNQIFLEKQKYFK